MGAWVHLTAPGQPVLQTCVLLWVWLHHLWLTTHCMTSRGQEVTPLLTLILGWWARGLDRQQGFDWELNHLVYSSSGSWSLSEATLKLHCCEEDAGVLWEVPPPGAQMEVFCGKFILFVDVQYMVELFSISHLVRCLLGPNAHLEVATFMLVWYPCPWTCSCVSNLASGLPMFPNSI